MMNMIILYTATVLHLLAYTYLVFKIWSTESSAGISGKAHILYALVYTTRYLDLFTVYISAINSTFKVGYLVFAYITVFSVYKFSGKSREQQYDTFRMEVLIACSMATALLINHGLEVLEVLWTFSIYLEAVAMLPQFHMISRQRHAQPHVLRYLAVTGLHKLAYLPHWGFRYYAEGHYDGLAIAAAVVQVILYLDFFARVVPGLQSWPRDAQPGIAIIGVGAGGNEEWLKDNMRNVLLTPASLVDPSGEKAKLAMDEEAK